MLGQMEETSNRENISKEELDRAMDARFSPEIHRKLNRASIVIVGLGGLGSHIAIMLARTDVGHIHLIDFDKVDVTNLNRQAYKIADLGKYKTIALKEHLMEINPYLDISYDTIKVTQENILSLLDGYGIVCEAMDNPEYKAMLVNTLLENKPEIKIVAGSGMAGYDSSNKIKTNRVMKNLYLCGDGENDAYDGIGLMAGRVGICAGHQANMIVRLLLGLENV